MRMTGEPVGKHYAKKNLRVINLRVRPHVGIDTKRYIFRVPVYMNTSSNIIARERIA